MVVHWFDAFTTAISSVFFQQPFKGGLVRLLALLGLPHDNSILGLYATPSYSAIPCLHSSSLATLEDLITCFDQFSVSEAYYNQISYDAAQPTADEFAAWTQTVSALLDVDGNCTSLSIPRVLENFYSVSLYNESSSGSQQSFCILSETQFDPESKYYVRGWGLVAVPASQPHSARSIHFAAPHPIYDANTTEQAAALFKGTGAKSLLIPGRMRTAFKENTTCILPSPGNGPYWKTDPAHDKNEPFFGAAKAIRAWQDTRGGCPSASCAFIQMHGKGVSTCKTDSVFMSTGLGRSESSLAWYASPDDAPIKRLYKQLSLTFSSWNVSLPTNSSCSLVATTNVFGRWLNGIDERDVCTRAADTTTVSGQFIHLEQSRPVRDPEYYDSWAEAISSVFVAV